MSPKSDAISILSGDDRQNPFDFKKVVLVIQVLIISGSRSRIFLRRSLNAQLSR
jgi:hypothetical protein